MTTAPKKTRLATIRPRTAVAFEALDALLDVPNERWDRTVRKLVKDFRSKSLRLEFPSSRLADLTPSANVSWTSVYESQVQHLPRMDRAEEFLMARRYEFARARAADSLASLGLDPETVDAILAPLAPNVFEATASMSKTAVAHARLCLDELDRLRNLYVEGSLYIAMGLVFRYRNLGVDSADLVQEGNASLFQAIDGFDWRRDVRFKTYAQYWVHQAILKTLYNASRTVRIPIWVQKAHRKIQRAQKAMLDDLGRPATAEEIAERVDMPPDRVEEILAVRRYAVSLDARIGSGDDEHSLGRMIADDSADPVPEQIEDGNLVDRIRQVMSDLPEREQLILRRRFGLDGQAPETLAEIASRLGVTAERVRQLQKAAIGRLQKPKKLQVLRAYSD